jgi:hypothetical protein
MKMDNRANQPLVRSRNGDRAMVAMNGLEKFSHLEDKIYRTIELTKALRQEKEDLERELVTLRNREAASIELVAENERLLAEREAIRNKVKRILEKIEAVDPEVAEAISG